MSIRHGDTPFVVALLELNVAACKAIDDALTAFLDSYPNPEAGEATNLALEEYAAAVRTFLETSDKIADLSSSSQPLCPRCGSIGEEKICPACTLDRLIPDPDFAGEEFERAEVNEEFFAVYQAYTAVVEGRAGLAQLTQTLQPLEFSLLEAQAIVEQALEEEPDNSIRQDLLQVVNTALEGLHRMHAVEENRQTRELNQGWMQVFKGGAAVNNLLSKLTGSDE